MFHGSRVSVLYPVIFMLLITIFSSAPGAADWTTYRHDNTRSGVSSESIQNPLFLQWMFSTTHAPKPAWMEPAEELRRMHSDSTYHVAAAKGVIYFGSSVDNKVYALDAKTGQALWTFFTEGPVRFAPSIWKDRLYFGSDDGYVYCLRAKDGKILWKYRAGPSDERVLGNERMISLWPVRTSVLVENGVVYFAAGVFPYEGIYICALKADDGAIVWKNDTIGDHAHELTFGGISPQGYLVASDDVLYVPSGRAMPAAFDRESGRFLYYCSPSGKVGGTWALLEGGNLIAGVDRSGTPAKVAYDGKTGRRKGDMYAWFPGVDMVVTAEVAYILSTDGIYAIDRLAYPEVSSNLNALRKERQELSATLVDLRGKISASEESSEAELDSQVDMINERMDNLVSREESMLKALTCKWQYLREDLYSLILVGDTVVTGGEGTVVALDAKTGGELWNSEVAGNVLGLSASDGKVFTSMESGAIYCFGEKEVSEAKEIESDIDPSPYSEDKRASTYEAAAEAVLEETGLNKGYCLVLDCGEGRLALELAKRSDLKIVGIESDPKKVSKAKKILDSAGLYGSRIVVEKWALSSLPDYFANLIVSGKMAGSGNLDAPSAEIFRVLKPHGGVAYIPDSGYSIPTTGYELLESKLSDLSRVRRGELEGAGSWTHLYADPQNTACSMDQLVKEPLGTLWFGEPGPEKMVERHAKSTSPVSINGRLFIQGGDVIMAYDAYNGTHLWDREIPGAVRARADVDGGNLVAADEGVYVAAYDKCYLLSPETGETVRTYEMPASPDGNLYRWGYLSRSGKILFGSSAAALKTGYAAYLKELIDNGKWKSPDEIPDEYRNAYESLKSLYPVPDENLLAEMHRSGRLWHPMANYPRWENYQSSTASVTKRLMTSNSIFALQPETGELLWKYDGERIGNIAISLGDGKIFFAESSISEENKQHAVEERQKLIEKGIYEEAETAPEYDDLDVRMVVCLDAATGDKVWEKPLDLTGCGGDSLGSAYHDGVLLFFGSVGNHDAWRFKDGSLRWKRLTALSGENGDVLWSQPKNYRTRPLIVGDQLIIEPRICDVRTGKIKMRSHPVTGEQIPWEFLRPGHTCAITSASANTLFYRSHSTAIYDIESDGGLTIFGSVRPGCWINIIPAGGVMLFPEASSGCTCSFPIRCSVAMIQKPDRAKPWNVFIAHGSMTPVKHFAINLGAPGDMKDKAGNLWLAYPNPRTRYGSNHFPDYGIKFSMNDEILQGMGYFCSDFKGVEIEGTDNPWLFTSGGLGLLKCEVPLINDIMGEKPGIYTVRMGFMAPAGDRKGERVFDIRLQGDESLRDFDIVNSADAQDRTVIREFKHIRVENNLAVEFVPAETDPTMAQAPIVNFIEIIREDIPATPAVPESAQAIGADEAEEVLETARADFDKGNYAKALAAYHSVFDANPAMDLKIQCLDGMAAIGDPESLSRISKYCVSPEPILWDYKIPEAQLRNSAIKTYVAIADNMAKTEGQKAEKMLTNAFAVSRGLNIHRQLLPRFGFVAKWYTVGTFPWDSVDNNLDKAFVGEPEVDLSASYQIADKILAWQECQADSEMIDLSKVFENAANASIYAYAEIDMPDDRELLLKIGSNNGFKCWFNGEEVGKVETENRQWKLDQDSLKVRVRKGSNTILLKISQAAGSCGFSARLTNLEGTPLALQ